MRRCWRLNKKALSEYVDRMLPEAEKAWVDAHLAACPHCSDEVKELRLQKERVHALPSVSFSADFDVNFKSALLVARQEVKAAQRANEPAPKRRVVYVGLPKPVQVFAVALLSVTAAIGIYTFISPGPTAYLAAVSGPVEIRHSQETGWQPVVGRVRLASGDEVRTGRGAEATVLAGRTYQAKLLEQSEWVPLELATAGNQKNVNFVLKRGTLLVKTGPAFKGKAMRVEGPSGKADVVGTAFMLRAMPQGETGLSVIEGKVDFIGKRQGDLDKVKVNRLEEAKVYSKGSPELPQPMKAQDWSRLAQFDPQVEQNPMANKLLSAIGHPEKLGAQELNEWNKNLMAEADKEMGSYGTYVLGNMQEEVMAPAEAMQQYVSVLNHFPDAVESAWAAEFLRSKLEMVPDDSQRMGEEVAMKDFAEPLRDSTTARDLTPAFLKGLEPQRRFAITQMELNEGEKNACVVERDITFERNLGDKSYQPVGYLDSVKNAATGEVVLRIGKLFTRDQSKKVKEVNTAIFHPDGRLIYTIDRQVRYLGEMPTGYLEIYKDPSGETLATLERKVELRASKGEVLRYSEIWKNSKGDVVLGRKRAAIVYNDKGEVKDYQDELIDVERRVAMERGQEQIRMAVGQEKLVKVAETPLTNMDEMLKKMREIRNEPSRFGPSREADSELQNNFHKSDL